MLTPTRKSTKTIEMAAMIDVVFILVLFFLVNSSIKKDPTIAIELPKVASAAASKPENFITIGLDKSNQLWLNQKKINYKQLEVELKNRQATSNSSPIHSKKNSANQLAQDQTEVYVKCDGNLPYKTIVKLLDILHKNGYHKYHLVTESETK